MSESQDTRAFLRLAAFYAATFAVLGVYMQFFPLWLADERGLAPDDVTWVLTGLIWARTIAGPLWAQRVDRTGRPRAVLIALLSLGLAVFLLFPWAPGRLGLFLCSAAFGCAYPPLHPILDNLALQTAHEHGLPYPRVRLWGSLSYLLAIVAVGMVLQRVPSSAVYAIVCGGLLVALAAASWLPRTPRPAHAGGAAPMGRLLRQVPFTAFLLAAALLQGSHAAYYSLSTIHWRAHGIGVGLAGLLWAEGIVGEIVLFFCIRDRAERLRPTTLMLLGAAGALVRWTVLGATTAVPAILAVNWLHGVTFGCTYLGTLRFIRLRVAPALQTTAQGLLGAATSGIGTALATLLAGRVYEQAPGGAFTAMAALAALGGLVALLLRRRRPASPQPD